MPKKYRVDIRGSMIPNDYKWYYEWFEAESTCPRDVQNVINAMTDGDELEVFINSGGGVIDVGSEIYTMLRNQKNVKIYITGEACSAASIVAMAGYCEMAPTSLMMVHCVSSGARGNHNDLQHMADVLSTADNALCTAYMAKSGMSRDDALAMMEAETWMTAEQALERGLIDKVMFDEEPEEKIPLVAGNMFKLPTDEMMNRVREMIKESDSHDAAVAKARLRLIGMKGEYSFE